MFLESTEECNGGIDGAEWWSFSQRWFVAVLGSLWRLVEDGLSGFSRREPRRRNVVGGGRLLVVGGGRLLVVGGGVTVVVQYAPAV